MMASSISKTGLTNEETEDKPRHTDTAISNVRIGSAVITEDSRPADLAPTGPPRLQSGHIPNPRRFAQLMIPHDIGKIPVESPRPSAFLPNFAQYDTAIAKTDRELNLTSTFRTECKAFYAPIDAKIYYHTIACYVIAKGQISYGISSPQLVDFVTHMDLNFEMGNLSIDAVAANFLLALAPSKPDSYHALVTAVLPALPLTPEGYDPQRLFFHRYFQYLPNLPMLQRILRRMKDGYSFNGNIVRTDPLRNIVVTATHTNNGDLDQVPITPDSQYLTAATFNLQPGLMNRDFLLDDPNAYARRRDAPVPRTVTTPTMTWLQYFGLTNDLTWFHDVIHAVTQRNNYLYGTITLSECMPTNIGATLFSLNFRPDILASITSLQDAYNSIDGHPSKWDLIYVPEVTAAEPSSALTPFSRKTRVTIPATPQTPRYRTRYSARTAAAQSTAPSTSKDAKTGEKRAASPSKDGPAKKKDKTTKASTSAAADASDIEEESMSTNDQTVTIDLKDAAPDLTPHDHSFLAEIIDRAKKHNYEAPPYVLEYRSVNDTEPAAIMAAATQWNAPAVPNFRHDEGFIPTPTRYFNTTVQFESDEIRKKINFSQILNTHYVAPTNLKKNR